MEKQHWEDFPVGRIDEFGNRLVSEAEIIEFATEFDPQPFHIDKEAAAEHFFGGIIASGWHTGSMLMRMLVDEMLINSTSMGSPGVDELRWKAPVRPGEILSVRSEVTSSTAHKYKSDRGFTKFSFVVSNEKGEVKLTMISSILFLKKAGGDV
ncbi:MAG: MaoC family dehydratase [Sneathiella sp.]|nr:MaoC family dehydratase [Sneathiella sp.]